MFPPNLYLNLLILLLLFDLKQVRSLFLNYLENASVEEWLKCFMGHQIMSTLYEKLGGEKTVKLVVEKFYERVLNDERINHFFEQVDMFKQKIHQIDFLTYAFEGSERYRSSMIREVHEKLVREKGLNDEHFNAFVEDFVETLKELEISPTLIEEAVAIANSLEHRNDVLNRKSS